MPENALDRRTLLLGVAVALPVALSGCGGPKYTNATVTGTLFIDGEPAPQGIYVTFSPEEPNSSSSSGITQEDGSFELNYNAIRKGATAGMNVVSLRIEPQFSDDGRPFWPDHLKQIASRLPRDAGESSTVKKDVQVGPNVIDIEISLRK